MISYHDELVTLLNGVLPTHYELFVDKNITLPCITYKGDNSYDTDVGDTVHYASQSYMIKVWSNRVSDLENYSIQIDEVLKPVGFRLTSSYELFNDGVGQKIMIYTATSYKHTEG